MKTPFEWVVFIFGGQSKLAQVLGVTGGAVSQWKRHGQIPDRHKPVILDLARVRGLDISANDLIEGRKP